MLTDAPALPVAGRINLRALKALCVDANPLGLDILSQTLLGFGVDRIFRAPTMAEAQSILKAETIDLVLCDAELGGESGNDFVRWLRLSRLEPNCHAPTFVITGHALEPEVINARDCGSSFVIAKPLTPAVLMQRILWVAAADRPFIESDHYTGPDRRFKNQGIPPEAPKGRRKSDTAEALGAPTGHNMSQEELDGLVKPQKVTL
ncbi:response regulator [Brevundimonas goettingensis]|uniref:Response regulator n=1 Tax=Brevundimonas goettingensis TaxID=2774190 RepID=A0A975GWV2_9CAUL|nr:response regulator [Brevundimonas goettingensis]QTC92214.1 response regulator [Brevundimonas goettingensis]